VSKLTEYLGRQVTTDAGQSRWQTGSNSAEIPQEPGGESTV